MGMPLHNRFDLLYNIRRNKYSVEKFSGFKLYAIIAHQAKDNKFIELLKNRFWDFSRQTGDSFLFITFIRPYPWQNWHDEYMPNYLKNHHKSKERTTLKNNLETDSWINEKTDISHFIQNCFGIKKSKSSLILLTRSLHSNDIYAIPTNSNVFEHQMNLITKFCEYYDEAALTDLVSQLHGYSQKCTRNIFRNLYDIMSLVSSPCIRKKVQCRRAKEIIKNEKNRISKLSGDEYEEEVFKVYELISSVNKTIFKDETESDYENKEFIKSLGLSLKKFIHEILPKYRRQARFKESLKLPDYVLNNLEDESRFWFKTMQASATPVLDLEETDYSPYITMMGKILEKELNSSVAQVIRKMLGINMPEYYNKYCPNIHDAHIETPKAWVGFNQYKTIEDGIYTIRKLRTIPLGNLLYAYKEWPYESYPPFARLNEDFKNKWEMLGQMRNMADHPEICDIELAEKSWHTFDIFFKNYSQFIGNIKRQLTLPQVIE